MKIYVADFGVYGMVVATASSHHEAYQKMVKLHPDVSDEIDSRHPEKEIEEFDLEGFTYVNWGDR